MFVFLGCSMISRDDFFLVPFSSQALKKLVVRWSDADALIAVSIFSELMEPCSTVAAVDQALVDLLLVLDQEDFGAVVPLIQSMAHQRLLNFDRSDVRDLINIRICQLFLRISPFLYKMLSEIFRDKGIFSGLHDLCIVDQWAGFIGVHLFRALLGKFPTLSSRASFEQIGVLRSTLSVLDCVLPPLKSAEKGAERELIFEFCQDKNLLSVAMKPFYLFLRDLEERSYMSYCLRLVNVESFFARFLLVAQAMIGLTPSFSHVTEEQRQVVRRLLISRHGHSGLLVLGKVFFLVLEGKSTEAGFAAQETLPLIPILLTLIHQQAEEFVEKTALVVRQKMAQLLPSLAVDSFDGGLVLARGQYLPVSDCEADLAAAAAALSSSSTDVFRFLMHYKKGSVTYHRFVHLLGQKLALSPVWLPVGNILFLFDAILQRRIRCPVLLRVGSFWLMIASFPENKEVRAKVQSKLGKKINKQATRQSYYYCLYDFRHGACYRCDTAENLVSCLFALLHVQIWRSANDVGTLNDLLLPGEEKTVTVSSFTVRRVWKNQACPHFVVERSGWPKREFSSLLDVRRWLRLECGIFRDGALLQEALASSVRHEAPPLWIAQVNSSSMHAARQFLLTGHGSSCFLQDVFPVWQSVCENPLISLIPGITARSVSLPDPIDLSQFLLPSNKETTRDLSLSSWGGIMMMGYYNYSSPYWHNACLLLRVSLARGVSIDFVMKVVELMASMCGFSDEHLWKQSQHYLSLLAGLRTLYDIPLPSNDLQRWQAFLDSGLSHHPAA